MNEWLLAALVLLWLAPAPAPEKPAAATPPPAIGHGDLDRIAFAVEGAESSHGHDKLMWSPDWHGPQGPMQVTHAAGLDVGGGNRFDPSENRQLGRAYLAGMFHRYGNWTDAVAAYNWGPGNLDRWIAAGRPTGGLSAPIQAYIERIMREFRDAKAATDPAVARPTARTVALTLPRADPPPPEIKDPALKAAFEHNAAAIKDLRGFIAGDDEAETAARAVLHALAGRRGYAQFARLRPADPHAKSPAALGNIAKVALAKLEAENAAIALVDARRHRKGAALR